MGRLRMLLAVAGLLVAGCSQPVPPADEVRLTVHVEPWRDADRIFKADPRWLGSPGHASIDMQDGRHLWLFRDGRVLSKDALGRDVVHLVHNAVALQQGSNPLTATMSYHWGNRPNSTMGGILPDEPADFFPGSRSDWFSLEAGFTPDPRMGPATVLLFLSYHTKSEKDPSGTREPRSTQVHATFTRGTPDAWEWDQPIIPLFTDLWPRVSVQHDGFVYVFADLHGDHGLRVLRLEAGRAKFGDFDPRYWCKDTWSVSDDCATIVLPGASAGIGMWRDSRSGRYLQVQAMPDPNSLGIRWASLPQGPWSELQPFHAMVEGGAVESVHAHPGMGPYILITVYQRGAAHATFLLLDPAWQDVPAGTG